ncbi:MAG TPA: M20/M25/M40 family metallo-hydrolase [Thermoanaerobaculia bacterium]|jgi:acetylornithine deacetylase/succinyl-diaminopimelate desuccinylase-like protein
MMTSSRARERVIALVVIATIAAAAVATWLYSNRMRRDRDAMLYIPKSSPVTPSTLLLEQYVRIKTVNPPGSEIDGARFLAQRLAEVGVKAEIMEAAPGRASLYARIKGKRPGDALMLLNHIDVVPPTGKWDRPPFSGSIMINMVYGRGTADMKGVAICELQAFCDIARSGRVPEHDLVFLAVADEERAGALGTRWLLDHRPDVFEGVRYAINEGGITEMGRESMVYFGIETGSKQMVDLDLAAPSRDNLLALRRTLEPYIQPRQTMRILPAVREFFSAIAPTRRENREVLQDIDATMRLEKGWLIPSNYAEMMMNTMWMSGVTPATGGGYKLRVQMRSLPDEEPDARMTWLTGMAKPFGAVIGEVRQKQGPAPPSASDTTLFRLIASTATRQYHAPAGPEVLPFSTTDSRFLRACGIACYGVQPFPLDFFQSLGIHGPNERVRVDWFEQGVTFTREIVRRWAFETP